jgi:hypothetical protein
MSATIGIISTAFLCASGIILTRLCWIRAEREDALIEYVVIPKDHYNNLQREAKRKIIIEQPQLPPPHYSEKTPLFSDDDTISI